MHDPSLHKFGKMLGIIDEMQKGSVLWFIYHLVFGIYEGYRLCCVLAFCSENYIGSLELLKVRRSENKKAHLKLLSIMENPHVLCDKCFENAMRNMNNGSNL